MHVGHMGQMQLCHAQAGQSNAFRAAREKGIAGEAWQGRAKSHMLGCLDIDFCEWDAADIARQWRLLMRQEAGGHLPFSTVFIFTSWIPLLRPQRPPTCLVLAGLIYSSDMPLPMFWTPHLQITLSWISGNHRHTACKAYLEHIHIIPDLLHGMTWVSTQAESSSVSTAP